MPHAWNRNKRFVPQLANVQSLPDDDFAKLFASTDTSHIKEGVVVKGRVVEINKDVVVVDIGMKDEGRIPVQEFTIQNHSLPEVWSIVDVYIERIDGKQGRTVLSREKAIHEELWVQLESAWQKGEYVDGVIFSRIKGGFTVDLLGIVAFLPGSQVDIRPIKDLSSLIGVKQPFQILKMDKKLGNIVVSRRSIIEESRSEARDEMLSQIKEGMEIDGVVKNITDYGAFIDLGSVDGLLHVTDMSWRRINHPSEMLTLGQQIRVKVTKFNEKTQRISLGLKHLDDNPWQNIQEELKVGTVMTGKVTNVTDYGAFIELKDGIEGLVHSSEISWVKSSQHPKKLLIIGQEVNFVILEIDTEKHRVSLSIKQCQPNPLIKFVEKNPVGKVIRAPIRNITDFGIFVALDDNIDGMIHETDISWTGKGHELLKSFKKDDIIECKMLAVDVEKERVSLGIKQLVEDPSRASKNEFRKGTVVTCTVINVRDDGIEVQVHESTQGFIRKSDLSSDKMEQKSDRFAPGDRVDAIVIGMDSKLNQVLLSVKALEIAEREKVIKEYGSTDSGASLGDILGATLGGHDQNDK